MPLPVNHFPDPGMPGVVYMKPRRWVFSSSPSTGIDSSAAAAWLKRAAEGLFALFFPDQCRVCGDSLPGFSRLPVCLSCLRPPPPIDAEFFCLRCRTPFLNARPLNSEGLCRLCAARVTAFDAIWSAGFYEGGLRDLIHLYKYNRMMPLAEVFGSFLSTAFPRDQRFDAIVPIPLHWRRRFIRGFDQSALLARALSGRTGIPSLNALRKSRYTRSQAGLTRSARRANIAGSFAAPAPEQVQGKRLLLIDDVFTTGATANAAATALKLSGAAHVAVLTLARADRLQFSRSDPAVSSSFQPSEVSADEHIR